MIYPNLQTYMQRVLLCAAQGFFYYTCGKTEPSKFEKLHEKFKIFYSVDESKFSRHRKRKHGTATTVLHACMFDQKIYFCLMSSAGKGRVHEREKLADLRQKNLRLVSPCSRFQLVNDNESWSWSMTPLHRRKLRERIHKIASLSPSSRTFGVIDGQRCDLQIERILDQIYAEPGFRLIRKEIGRLVVYLNREWSRLRPATDPRPSQRTFLHYIRMLPTREKSTPEKMAANAKKRSLANGQTVKERQEMAREKREFAEKRRRFRRVIKQNSVTVLTLTEN